MIIPENLELIGSDTWEKEVELGEIGVDSGALAIVDPAYLNLPKFYYPINPNASEQEKKHRENWLQKQEDSSWQEAMEDVSWRDFMNYKVYGEPNPYEVIKKGARGLRDLGLVFDSGGDGCWNLILTVQFTDLKFKDKTTGEEFTARRMEPLKIEFKRTKTEDEDEHT